VEHKDTLCIGRSHGIHAEPTTFGLKLAQAYAEFERNRDRLTVARHDIATCAISGSVGTFASIDPAVEAHVAAQLGLDPEPVSSQVIPRDRHGAVGAADRGCLRRAAAPFRRVPGQGAPMSRRAVRSERHFAASACRSHCAYA
jgi:adenylosuccinate lyase